MIAKKQDRTRKRVGAWLLAILVLGGLFAVIAWLTKEGASSSSGGEVESATSTDQSYGVTSSSVSLIEYSDFECPACALFFPEMKKIKADFGGRIHFTYRHFPLPQHSFAVLAATVAEAAGKQGKFWEMHDMLFERQVEWTGAKNPELVLSDYARQLGLNMQRFEVDRADQVIREKINNDRSSGERAGVSGTPTFFLNGKKVENLSTYEDLYTLVQDSIR